MSDNTANVIYKNINPAWIFPTFYFLFVLKCFVHINILQYDIYYMCLYIAKLVDCSDNFSRETQVPNVCGI